MKQQANAERVTFARSHYRGREYVAIRVYFRNGNGKWLPSPKGINLRAELFAADAVDELRNALLPPRRPDEPVAAD